MRLVCKKYQWSSTTLPEERNFFSSIAPTLIETIDLSSYVVKNSLGEVSYTFEDINDENNLHTEASSFSFEVKSNISGPNTRGHLKDFFEVSSPNSLIRWLLDFYSDENILLHQSIIYKDGIKLSVTKKDILSINSVGYEKEFERYFANKPLVSSSTLANVSSQTILQYNGLRLFTLRDVFLKNFTSVEFDFGALRPSFIDDWYVLEKPYTYSPSDVLYNYGDLFHCKTGYACYENDGVDRFTFFSSLLKVMGWVWGFYLGKLYIKRRSDAGLETVNINYADQGIEDGFENKILSKQVDAIIIDDGEYFALEKGNENTLGGLSIFSAATNKSFYLGGSRKVFYGTFPYTNIQRPFKRIEYVPSENVYLNDYRNWTFERESSTIRRNGYDFEFLSIDSISPYHITKSPVAYPEFRTLNINPIINSQDNSGGYDKNNPRADTGAYYGNGNFFSVANQPITDSHVLYRGNPGNALIKWDATYNKFINYEIYCESQEFKNNFKKFLRSDIQTIFNVEVRGLYTDPFVNYKLSDYHYDRTVESKTLSLVGSSWDYRKRRTKLTFQIT